MQNTPHRTMLVEQVDYINGISVLWSSKLNFEWYLILVAHALTIQENHYSHLKTLLLPLPCAYGECSTLEVVLLRSSTKFSNHAKHLGCCVGAGRNWEIDTQQFAELGPVPQIFQINVKVLI